MNAIDFEYDGQYLSDYGFIICDFDGSSGANVAIAGSNITFIKVAKHKGKSFSLTSTQYDECITVTFDICKDPEVYAENERTITDDEFRDLMRWLNRREFCKFQVYDPDREFDTCYYNASFNVQKIKVAEQTCGLELTMETDKPFGYGLDEQYKYTFTGSGQSHIVVDISDEIGFVYPQLKITCKTSGTLQIRNDLFDDVFQIKNCSNGEVITVDGENQIITSSLNSHKVYDDFNYTFLKIANTFRNRRNEISTNMSCDLELRYTPIIKDVP